MKLDTPSVNELNINILASLEASFGQQTPLLPKAFQRVLAKTLAAIFVLLYKYANGVAQQMIVQAATFDVIEINGVKVQPLLLIGQTAGVSDPKPADHTELYVDVTVNVQGGSLPAGTQLVSVGAGVVYLVTDTVLLNNSTVQARIKSTVDGAIGNLAAGETLTFVETVANVEQTVIAGATIITGTDAETETAYRQRVLDRFQKPPQGGAYADYELWGEQVPGVVNVYPYRGVPGEVDVYVEATAESAGNVDGIPTTAQLQAVLDSINEADRRPVGAFVNVLPITRAQFDVHVVGILDVDNIATVRANIEDALTEYFAAAEPFIGGLTPPPRNDRIILTRLTGFVADIVTEAGGTFTNVLLSETGGSGFIENYPLSEGEKARLANLTFL